MNVSGLPFDDIRNLLEQLPKSDDGAAEQLKRAFADAGHNIETLGRLAALALQLARAKAKVPPLVGKAGVALYAATHGFARQSGEDQVSAMRERVEAIAAGAAPVSHLCVANDLSLNVFDLALDLPTGDITLEAALDERGCAATIAFGMEAIAEGVDLLGLGTLGRDADLAGYAVLAGLSNELRKLIADTSPHADLIARALECHSGQLDDPLEVLRRLGGRDIAALAGAILAARMQNVPVILDGVPALAAAACLYSISPAALEHCTLACAAGTAQRRAADWLNLEPLLDLEIETGEGSAAALAAGMMKSAAALAGGMAEVARRQRKAMN